MEEEVEQSVAKFPSHLRYVTAPMVDASDIPFRSLIKDATTHYTQMLLPSSLIHDRDYREFHLRQLQAQKQFFNVNNQFFTVAQLGGSDINELVQASKVLSSFIDGIDINLGCPQERVVTAGYGAALLRRDKWPLVHSIVSSLRKSTTVPISCKIRLCEPASSGTLELATLLEQAGCSHLTLHARFPAPSRRRHGPAHLEHVRTLVNTFHSSCSPTMFILSNGNVRCYDDIVRNLSYTNAAGVMVGEALLHNPLIFSNSIPDPFDIARQYVHNCELLPNTTSFKSIVYHLRQLFSAPHLPKPLSGLAEKYICKFSSKIIVPSLSPKIIDYHQNENEILQNLYALINSIESSYSKS